MTSQDRRLSPSESLPGSLCDFRDTGSTVEGKDSGEGGVSCHPGLVHCPSGRWTGVSRGVTCYRPGPFDGVHPGTGRTSRRSPCCHGHDDRTEPSSNPPTGAGVDRRRGRGRGRRSWAEGRDLLSAPTDTRVDWDDEGVLSEGVEGPGARLGRTTGTGVGPKGWTTRVSDSRRVQGLCGVPWVEIPRGSDPGRTGVGERSRIIDV